MKTKLFIEESEYSRQVIINFVKDDVEYEGTAKALKYKWDNQACLHYDHKLKSLL